MKSILLVEDDPFLIDICVKKFKAVGYQVKVAKDGQEAIKILSRKKPDLVLLDIVMPGMAGWEVLRRLKQDKEFADLKIIVLSNLSQKQEVEKGLGLGAEKYLIKSQFTPAEVVEQVREILK